MSNTLPTIYPARNHDTYPAREYPVPCPMPCAIVPGNHNFVVYFYTRDSPRPDGTAGKIRVSENYTTPKTYSPRLNTEQEAVEKCREWAEHKAKCKSDFMAGYRIEKLETHMILDEAPEGVTFVQASSGGASPHVRHTPEYE